MALFLLAGLNRGSLGVNPKEGVNAHTVFDDVMEDDRLRPKRTEQSAPSNERSEL